MTERPLTIALDGSTMARVEAAAASAGLSVDDYVLEIIEAALSAPGVAEHGAAFEGPDQRTEAARRYQREQAELALAEYDRTGVSIPLEDALRTFDDALEAALARKR